jgi:hypothetical protein
LPRREHRGGQLRLRGDGNHVAYVRCALDHIDAVLVNRDCRASEMRLSLDAAGPAP